MIAVHGEGADGVVEGVLVPRRETTLEHAEEGPLVHAEAHDPARLRQGQAPVEGGREEVVRAAEDGGDFRGQEGLEVALAGEGPAEVAVEDGRLGVPTFDVALAAMDEVEARLRARGPAGEGHDRLPRAVAVGPAREVVIDDGVDGHAHVERGRTEPIAVRGDRRRSPKDAVAAARQAEGATLGVRHRVRAPARDEPEAPFGADEPAKEREIPTSRGDEGLLHDVPEEGRLGVEGRVDRERRATRPHGSPRIDEIELDLEGEGLKCGVGVEEGHDPRREAEAGP